MAYEVEFTDRGDHLVMRARGQRDIEETRRLWAALAARSLEHGQGKVLALLDLRGRFTLSQVYELASHLEDLGWRRGTMLAIVDLVDESRPDNEFGSTVAANRGYVVAHFATQDEAMDWLGVRPDGEPRPG